MSTSNEIRSLFLDYFKKNDHEIVASSGLVPRNDPSLLFANSGMVQFKNYFTGTEKPPYARASTAQKCVRAGGKHNDLERVGYTARHHTFFEMLGNFSFGDYFKEEAIHHAWNVITKEYGLAKDRLLVTVYAEDDEAFGLWQKIAGLKEDRIIRIATSDNFWSMGDTGPCGPCSEIFYDHGDNIPGGPPGSPDEDGDRFIEIWNLVFMQFEQLPGGARIPLPKPSIDTGMGLERITAVMQHVHNNYEIDTFKTIIEASVEKSKAKAEGDKIFSHRVIADHLRSSCFLMADGVLPSNEGRGYVLRRIMRRAMRHAHILGCKDPLLYQLVPTLVDLMGVAYPELRHAEVLLSETLRLEEERFKQTLDRGLKLLSDEVEKLDMTQDFPGDVAFKLYDTFGFPLDLTQDILKQQNRIVDQSAFDTAMARQKAEARAAWSGSGEAQTEKIWFELRESLGATEFLGYQTESAEGKIISLLQDDKVVTTFQEGQKGKIITNQTPFYGESGGQIGDIGQIKLGSATFVVENTQKKARDLIVHEGYVQQGQFKNDDVVHMLVDNIARSATRANHSATHLLHEALRNVLGNHVSQKGSLVAPDKLRFDFSHQKPISPQELRQIEDIVNARIALNAEVITHLLTPEQAIKKGALALFGEKYGDEVRVVAMGGPNVKDVHKDFSLELCGGTHVTRTGDIGLFKIVSESAVAAGVRRIEAITGQGLLAHLYAQEDIIESLAEILKATPKNMVERVQKLQEERKRLERELVLARQSSLMGNTSQANENRKIGNISYVGQVLTNVPAKDLKPMVDQFKQKLGSGFIVLASIQDGQASIVVGVTKDLCDRFNAVDYVRIGAEILGGTGGGGRPDMAQAGGPNGDKADLALKTIEEKLKSVAG
jgi:alanyl-tRNA synthetase